MLILRLWGVIITLGFCGSSPLLFDPASAASPGQDLQDRTIEEAVNNSPVSQESSAFEVDTYFLRERVTPSATLRVVDETGRATEIPVDFSQARVEPRGFWGDVAVNGLALFSASLCIVLLKEALAWSAARRRKARAKAQSDIETRRRTAISAQLEAADLEIRNLRTSSKEGKGEGLDDEVRRLMDLLDAYRQELKNYDAPALMAYLDNLVVQAAHLLRTHNRSVDANLHLESASGQRAANPPRAHLQGAAGGEAPDASSESTEALRAASASGSAASSQAPAHTPQSEEAAASVKGVPTLKIEQPDMDLVHRVVMANPGMPPAEALRVARELTSRRRRIRLLEP
ncbi:hypothetical protein Esti_003301 [Eimeria stiedai]